MQKVFGKMFVLFIVIVGVVIVTLLVSGLAEALTTHGLGSSDAAGWVQAIGAILGLAIAIAIPFKLYKDQEQAALKKDEREVLSMLLSLRDELEVLWDMFEERAGKPLMQNQGSAFAYRWPVQDNPFTIYDAHVDRISKVEDDNLRQSIVRGYALAAGMLQSFRMNNNLVTENEQTGRMMATILDDQRKLDTMQRQYAAEREVMTTYADQMRKQYIEVKTCIDDLRQKLPRKMHQNRL